MLTAVLSGFILSVFAPAIYRVFKEKSGWILALLPFGLFVSFAGFISDVVGGRVISTSRLWVPSLGVNLSFYLDGLSLIFALLISGIGTLVIIYAGGYLAGDGRLGRLYMFLLIFMASMLGLTLADNLITLFIFWELTGISSYLLIGYDHERTAAREAALQALLVTGLGGLALLAGLVMLGLAGGSFEISALLGRGDEIRSHAFYLPALLLVLAGAFTKSAQFPFHFWLPGAMEAPAPVSAYLHSATMVKAGVYLLARMTPVLGGTDEWYYSIVLTGGATMLIGAALAIVRTDLKLILAYSTVSSLGTLIMLIGIGTDSALTAAVVFLLVHSLYKGALFLVSGAVDHETGTRDIEQLGGLRRVMPVTAVAAVLAALSMAGLPPLFGFIGKELIYEAALEASGWFVAVSVFLANVVMVSLAAIVAVLPFFGQRKAAVREAHEAPPAMLLGPALLALAGLLIGPAAGVLMAPLVAAATGSMLRKTVEIDLAMWHGVNRILLLSMATVGCGAVLYLLRGTCYRIARLLRAPANWGPARWYELTLRGVLAFAGWQTRVLQNGHLRAYILTVVVATLGLTGYVLFDRVEPFGPMSETDIRSYEWVVAAILIGAVFATVRSTSRLTAVATLGVVGFGIALVYILYGAPDLAKTQFAIETLTVVLFVLVLYRLPRFVNYSSRSDRMRDLLTALAVGGLMTTLTLLVTTVPRESRLAGYFAENSLVLAKGRNVVNVILVDYRSLDTLGEIVVLSTAAIGVLALLKLRSAAARDAVREGGEK